MIRPPEFVESNNKNSWTTQNTPRSRPSSEGSEGLAEAWKDIWTDDVNKNSPRSSNIPTSIQDDDQQFTTRTVVPSCVSSQGVQTDRSVLGRGMCNRHRQVMADPMSSGHSNQSSKSSSLVRRPSFKQLRAITNVNFPRWRRNNKNPRKLSELLESYFRSVYKPFSAVRKPLMVQAREVLQTGFDGDYAAFENQFLKIASSRLTSLRIDERHTSSSQRHDHRRRNKKSGWPLSCRNCVIVHLVEIDPEVLRDGDFYFSVDAASRDNVVLLTSKVQEKLCQRSLDAKEFLTIMAGMVSESPPEEEEDPDGKVKLTDVFAGLAHLMVSVERGIRRIEVEQVSQELWNWNHGGGRLRRPRAATRDSWVQTTPPGETSELGSFKEEESSFAPLASEEEFSSDSEMKLNQDEDSTDPSLEQISCTSSIDNIALDSLADVTSILELDCELIQSQICILSGCRDLCGRSVVYVGLQRLRTSPKVTPVHIAQLILYFTTIPKKDVARLGIVLLVDAKDASSQECHFLEKCLFMIEACAPRTVSLVLAWQKQSHKPIVSPTSSLHGTHIRFESIVNANQFLKYIRRCQLLPEYGGTFIYNHEEWINFHKLLDPFTDSCRQTGQHLLSVMQDLRSHQLPPSSSLSSAKIEQHQRHIMEALEDRQLRHLQLEGDNFLSEMQELQKKTPQNQDHKELLEKCTLLYKQLQSILDRLSKLADQRLGRLQDCMMLRTFEEESSQVLSWMCHKGEETLKRHKTLADDLTAFKEQESDFQKFYFIAMRQIERGNDLLEDAPKPKVMSTDGVNGMASVLKTQIDEFTERLEEARERLEDSSRCYGLLDKCYEWALDTMRLLSTMKMDSSNSLDVIMTYLKQVENHVQEHPPITEDVFEEIVSLAKKLNNDGILEQSEMAKKKIQETVHLVQARISSLETTKHRLLERTTTNFKETGSNNKGNPYIWMPVISSTPYRTPSQPFLHRGSSLYGSQQILRESTGSYTSFPSSYYPAVDLKTNRVTSKNNLLKGSSSSSLIKVMDNSDVSGYRPSSSGQSMSSGDSRDSLDDSSSLEKSVAGESPQGPWRTCEEALSKATAEVKEQNYQLQQLSDKIINDEMEMDIDDAKSLIKSKQTKPAPVNMHLLRCASCSDFEELLSNKNVDNEAENKTKKILKLIMREMIQTETDYVKSLEYIIENYVPLLQKCDIPQALRGHRNVLFGNIEKIYEFHNCYFLQELEHCESSPFAVGQCFLKYEPQFYLYALYNKNKPKSDDLMAEYGSSFFKEKQRELGDKMDLASYLLKPVQRMGKYALLLKQLLKECPERDYDYNDLKAAEEMVHFQLRHGNDLLAMDALKECDVNVKEQGRLLRQEEFLVWQGKSHKTLRHLFLFEDLILFSKARRDLTCKGHDFYQYKNSIKTTDIGLTEQVADSPTKFEIWFRKRKTQDIYTIEAPSSEVKHAWIQDISKLLWRQALRNRELRLAEMSSMGIGNKPCLDISPSQDQICDRSISLQQLNKTPRFRNSIAISSNDNVNNRPCSVISLSSSSSSSGNSNSSTSSNNSVPLCTPEVLLESDEKEQRRLSMALQSQCSAESGIFTDASMSGESFGEPDFPKTNKGVVRSDSVLSQTSMTTVIADT